MCYHKSLATKYDKLMEHYTASFKSIKAELELLKDQYATLKPRYDSTIAELQKAGLYDPSKTIGRQKKEAKDKLKELFSDRELDFIKMFDKAKTGFTEDGITRFHENGYDYLPTPIITTKKQDEFKLHYWGMVPFWVKNWADAKKQMANTLNCRDDEMYNKPSWRDAAKAGQRCLIPVTGFYEWRWLDEDGNNKIPYFIRASDQTISSLAGLYSSWKDPATNQYYSSYTVITTEANQLMAEIHNTKKRMPVIIPKEYEKDWLNPNLTEEDVKALCRPYANDKMKAHTVSKLISTQNVDTNVEDVLKVHAYEELNSK